MSRPPPPLNNPLSEEWFLELCGSKPLLSPQRFTDDQALGPRIVTFQKRGAGPFKGFPLKELLNLKQASHMLDDAENSEIRVFHDAGVVELMLVIWGPERRQGSWFHTIRRIPLASQAVPLTNKAALGHLIALEYFSFSKESNHRRDARDTYPDLHPEDLSIISLQCIRGNVYQAELAFTRTMRSRGAF